MSVFFFFLFAYVKGRPCGSVAQLAECSYDKREAMGSTLGRATIFSSPVTFGGSACVRGLGNEHKKVHVSLFRANSGTKLIKQGGNVKERPCGSVAQLAECSHGKREAMGSSLDRATIFSSPVTLKLYGEQLRVFLSVIKSLETTFVTLDNNTLQKWGLD